MRMPGGGAQDIAERTASYFRASASPGAAAAIMRMNREIDVRHVLSATRVPTLSNFLLLFGLPVGAANQRKRYARAECLSGFQMQR